MSRPLDVQIDAAFANGVRAVLTRLAHTRRDEHDKAWKDCEAMERNRRAEIHASLALCPQETAND